VVAWGLEHRHLGPIQAIGVDEIQYAKGLSLVSPGMPKRLKRRDLKEHVLRRARELAESGRFDGWHSIEFQLRFFEGFTRARIWIDGPLRKELDALCRNARIWSRLASTKTTE
jgi:hypothetical protein